MDHVGLRFSFFPASRADMIFIVICYSFLDTIKNGHRIRRLSFPKKNASSAQIRIIL